MATTVSSGPADTTANPSTTGVRSWDASAIDGPTRWSRSSGDRVNTATLATPANTATAPASRRPSSWAPSTSASPNATGRLPAPARTYSSDPVRTVRRSDP